MSREVHVRFWERLGVQFPRATRQKLPKRGIARHARSWENPDVKMWKADITVLMSDVWGTAEGELKRREFAF